MTVQGILDDARVCPARKGLEVEGGELATSIMLIVPAMFLVAAAVATVVPAVGDDDVVQHKQPVPRTEHLTYL